MHFMRNLGRGLSSAVFKLSLFGVAVTAALLVTFGQPQPVKDAASDSGIYNHIVGSVLENAQRQDPVDAEVSLDDQAVRTIAEQTFSPGMLRSSVEQAIDGTYNWLEGRASEPDFRIDLSGAKQNLANATADLGIQRLQGLPVCTSAQIRQINSSDFDAFKIPCRPPGINLDAERQRLTGIIQNNQDILKDPVITAQNVKSADGQNPFENAKAVPEAFQWGKRLPWIFGGLSVISALGVIFLHDDRRRGLHVVARTVLVTGLVLLATAAVTDFLFDKIHLDEQVAANAGLRDALIALIRILSQTLNRTLVTFAGIYTLTGTAVLLIIRLTKPPPHPDPIVPPDEAPKK